MTKHPRRPNDPNRFQGILGLAVTGLVAGASALLGLLLIARDAPSATGGVLVFALACIGAALGMILVSVSEENEGQFDLLKLLLLALVVIAILPPLLPIVVIGILATHWIKGKGVTLEPVRRGAGAILVFAGGAGIAYMVIANLLSIPSIVRRPDGWIVLLAGMVAIPFICMTFAALILIGRSMWRRSPSGRNDDN